MSSDLRTALAGLPKTELHIHVEGTLEPEQTLEFALRNQVKLPYDMPDDISRAMDFTDLQSFLDLHYSCMKVLRTERDFFELASAYLHRAASDGVRHVELSFDPQIHAKRGVGLSGILRGLRRALDDAWRDHGLSGGLIMCFQRDLPVAGATALLETVADNAGSLLSVGLDSSEIGYPPELFTEVFRDAAVGR